MSMSDKSSDEATSGQSEDTSTITEGEKLARAELEDPTKALVIPDKLLNPHHLVLKTMRGIDTKAGPTSFAYTKGPGCLKIRVSPKNLDRAFRIYDTVIRGLEKRGYTVSVSQDESPETRVAMLGTTVSFLVREGRLRGGNSVGDRPNGVLILEIEIRTFKPREWRDTPKKPLEEKLNQFVAGLIRIAEEHAAWKRRQAQEEKDRYAEVIRKRQEADRVWLCAAAANAWKASQDLGAFIAAVRAEAERRQEPTDPESSLGKWLEWATRHMRNMNPLSSGYPLPSIEATRVSWYWENFSGIPEPKSPFRGY